MPFPSEQTSDVVLRDGGTVHVRPLRRGDEQTLVDFFGHLSQRSRYLRFFGGGGDLGRFVEKGIDADPAQRFDLVATAGSPPTFVAHALYATTGEQRAEVAFAVDDTYQHRGLGTIMLGQLAEAARTRGIAIFEAVTLPENRQMVSVFRESGFPTTVRAFPDELHVELPTSLGKEAIERFDARDRISAAAAVRTILAPTSIALVGASRRPDSVGGAVLANLVAAGFTGSIYPVNPSAETVQSLPTYRSVAAIPDPVELAIVVVPAPAVAEVARECGAKGVRSLVVISAGFGEIGAEGAERQRELIEICRDHGMRLVGPNCFGVLNTDPGVRLNATFGRQMPPRGHVALLTQSGALGIAVVDRAHATGLGVSSFVSNGNKADISGNDLLSYWETDEQTQVVMLYLESFGNPRKFARVSRHVGRQKPIVAVKSGRSKAGARATTSHTGALVAASDVTVDALFRQSGVIRCDTLPELFDVAGLLERQPAPRGHRVAIVTNAGGPAILCADACEGEGLDVVTFEDGLRDELRSFLPAEAAVSNPVDMIASATGVEYRRTIEAIADAGAADAVIAIYIPPLVSSPAEIANGIEAAVEHIDASEDPIPVAYAFMATEPSSLGGRLPVFAYPEQAARAVARAARYGAWRSSPLGEVRRFGDVDAEEAGTVLAGVLGRGPGWLSAAEVGRLLSSYGIERPPERVVTDAADAARAAGELGYPVALKAIAEGVIHKTDVGGVVLDLSDEAELSTATQDMTERFEREGLQLEGFLVQRMATGGVEMLVGVVHDPMFGPVVAVGAGGVTAELVRDVSVRITPLTDADVSEMIGSLRTAPLLHGYRGAPAADVDALEELIHRVGALVEAHPEVAELDCNPVVVSARGAVVVDARVRAEVPAPLSTPIGAKSSY